LPVIVRLKKAHSAAMMAIAASTIATSWCCSTTGPRKIGCP
jgi:hypothetical protein